MDVSPYITHLLARNSFVAGLSDETLDILRYGSNRDYINKLADLALDSRYTSIIFSTHYDLFVEICSSWLTSLGAGSPVDPIIVILALTRVLPLAPHLAVYAKELLFYKRPGILQILSSRNAIALRELPESCLRSLLLALFRLLVFDNEEFARLISPAQFQMLLSHNLESIKYLTIRILCLYLHASDGTMEKMIKKYCVNEKILGSWEHLNIDYAFLTLWEERRMKNLSHELEESRDLNRLPVGVSTHQRTIARNNLSNSTLDLGNVLVPMLKANSSKVSNLIMTKTFIQNTTRLAHALNKHRPVLLTGLPGCGKTSLLKTVADELGQGKTMITLHLNDQSDAKLLIGMYVSTSTPGSFRWQPGVLTKAVLEGRWLVIEDLDRAPTEVLSTILPLLERRELLVPQWGETIRPASDFKLFATIRTNPNLKGDEITLGSNMLGIRHWLKVPLALPDNEELAKILECKYPILSAYIPKIIGVYDSISKMMGHMRAKLISQRQVGPRNLYRWCSRLRDLLSAAGVRSGNEPISEILNDIILLEAIDCFAGHLPDGVIKSEFVKVISQELHTPSERVKYCLEARKPEHTIDDEKLRIGRACITKSNAQQSVGSTSQRFGRTPFAITTGVLRIMESIGVAIKQAEPCLLVGETGTGKTTLIQQLARTLGYNLHVINLSQQSEASDLLGGFKPLRTETLAVPMKEEFDSLFENTFSAKRNQEYLKNIGRAVSKGRWSRALRLWKEALRSARDNFKLSCSAEDDESGEPRQKKRKLETKKNLNLQQRWDKFASSLEIFQKHIASDSKGLAFAFVEGHVVKAAKNGDWLLLDEINLASQDTLESLADLISNGTDDFPTLYLPETGSTERIQVHKDFRIFGAMNPATDVGKRDLPSSLRSRFTEIYLNHSDQDFESLLMIVKVYLGMHNHRDLHIAVDITHLYLEIQKLAGQNKLIDGANQRPHYSLRTLTKTLIYVSDIMPMYGLRRAFYEGFSMSFLTLLDKESTLLVSSLIHKYILGSSSNAQSLIRQMPRAPQDTRAYVQFRHYWIARGDDPVSPQPYYVITPFIERNLLNLVRAASTRRFPVLLQGPTSSGKTSMVGYLARISGNRCVRINNHEHTDLQEYLGSYISGPDGRLQYQEGILVRALKEGHWVVLDELNLAPTDVLEALNRLLDDNKELLVPETQQVIKPHENFMLFATQNPPGMYGGRKILSRAFRNRFLELNFDDIPEDELETILRERSQIAPSFCAKIVAVYKRLSNFRQGDRLFDRRNSFATLRDLFRWALRDAENREQLAINGFMLLAERVRNPNERLMVKKTIEDVMKISIDISRIYEVGSLYVPSSSSFPCTQNVIWTKSMRRLYALVSQALSRNEPVLLVGETGSGKTTICQVIAAAMNKSLHIVNAHQNMETGDLIGAQRPIRNRAATSTALVHDLTEILRSRMVYEDSFRDDLSSLLNAYDTLIKARSTSVPTQKQAQIAQTRKRLETLFEWSDGSLVHAMRDGQYFLLDEISLADDSVLERMNSVLESDRSLLLAEQGSTDNLVYASEGFQFFATMNPGGDYGKRELSPALRNRFTEIWVPCAADCEEMLQIAEAKLSAPFRKFSSPMVSFAEWHGNSYNRAAPNISIRDLLTWILFLNSYSNLNPHHALLHGAAMVYIDRLGANSSAGMHELDAEVYLQRQECLQKLSVLFSYDMESIYMQEIEFILTDHKLSLGPFSLEIATGPLQGSSGYHLDTPTTKANAMKMIRAMQLQKPVLLEGSPGVGKSTIVMALADLAGVSLTRINLSDQTELMDLFGSDIPIDGANIGNFGWQDAPFLRAMQKGEWVLLDEMNLASQTVLEGLNSCFDHRGQVYISELDLTFTRHPNFRVFATQNPHRQGGGRKGLPASFVNRFTTVYTDAFTARDLLMICKKCYPQHPIQSMEALVRSVTELGNILQTDIEIGAYGGPWEINLRDLLRWLQLLHSQDLLTSAGSPIDYGDLVFLQRFRRPKIGADLMKVLEKRLPTAKKTPSYIHNMTTSYIQVGFAFIQRNSSITPAIDRQIKQVSADLRLVESILLCIKSNWPCLLVGPSGAGKTSLIQQLASFVGSHVVNLPLNADMDTMDLIGGYEQIDIQRERVSLVKQLRQITQSHFTNLLISAPDLYSDIFTPEELLRADVPDLYSDIFKLEELLRADVPDIAEITKLSRKLGKRFPHLGYLEIASECEKIIRQSSEDTRARFEWVDGFLVRALKQGHWLVLDNANLCSSSVLDRLNALLEPNGFLSINEHCDSNGFAHIVKPHPNFRLFLTIDPRYGELSRAMRNRCIEIYVSNQFSTPPKPFSLLYEPSIFHFQVFERINWTGLDNFQLRQLSSLCSDLLTTVDYKLCHRWQGELAKGLLELTPITQALLVLDQNIRHNLLEFRGNIIKEIQATYGALATKSGLPADFPQNQFFNPLMNPILNTLNARCAGKFDLAMLGESLQLLVEIRRLDARQRLVLQQVISKPISQMTRLERSLAKRKPKSYDPIETRHVGEFLKIMTQALEEFLDRSVYEHPKAIGNIVHCVDHMVSYLQDMFDLTNSPDFDVGVFQTYLSVGRYITAQASVCDETNVFAEKLNFELSEFNLSWQLSTGLSMEVLWRLFKPHLAKNLTQIEAREGAKQLANRFDAIQWTTGGSVRDLEPLRWSIIGLHDAAYSADEEVDGRFKGVENAIHELENQSIWSIYPGKPHFSNEFEGLCQQHRAIGVFGQSLPVLDLLAGRPASLAMNTEDHTSAWSLLVEINRITGIFKSSTSLMNARNTLHVSLLGKLEEIRDVPLGKLSLLREEMSTMTKNILILSGSSNYLRALNILLARIVAQICQAHKDFLEPLSLSSCLAYIEKFIETTSTDTPPTNHPVLRPGPQVLDSHYFYEIVNDYLNPALRSLHDSLEQRPQKLSDTATAWISVFACCLRIYVPDRPFDPALRPVVERDRHQKRVAELQAKLQALQDFQMILTGQSKSFWSQRIQNKIETLGAEPQAIVVPRPHVSELSSLSGEFKNLLDSIVFRIPNMSALRSFFEGRTTLQQELQLLTSNISRIIPRLCNRFTAYEDITKPLVAMLRGLDVGLALALLADPMTTWTGSNIRQICRSTPFLGMQLSYYSEYCVSDQGLLPENDFDSYIKFLENSALYRSVSKQLPQYIGRKICEVFHSLHKIWRERLEIDKQHNATESSLYRYQDAAVENAATDENDMLEVFPDYIENEDNVNGADESRPDQRSLAQQLTGCHDNIFKQEKPTKQLVLSILEESAKKIGNLWLHNFDAKACNVPNEETICAVILGLTSHQNRLNELSVASKSYNFYVDANLAEARNLINIVQLVQARFSYLAKAWPEHATIKNVLQTSFELISLSHNEPIAKILIKTEQLHGLMHEWEVVASKEFSATDLYDQITNLLISWRRLELSTWAQLLDMEDRKANADVESWWFVAYEAIIAVPLSMINSGENFQTYPQQLFAILEEFLVTTSIGQYSRRLRLIECFKMHVGLLSVEEHSLHTIRDTLVNFLCFYTPSQSFIQEALNEGRKKLELEMREVILLASWKDTNIVALRESAKRSHHKLFKIIRKYRAILARPVEDLIGRKIVEKAVLPETLVENSALQPLPHDIQAIEISKRYIPSWTHKPLRLTDPFSTARKMISMGQLPPEILDCSHSLQHFADDLIRSIEGLQKETPPTATQENEQLRKHLKTRKRVLYAETLRKIRNMGFQSNLSSSMLAQQSSCASILGKCPSMPIWTAGIRYREADFHSFLRLMRRARGSIRNHSPDLNTRDISRSMGYLESILFLIVKQRNYLISSFEELACLDKAIKMLRNLWAPEEYTLQRVNVCEENAHKDRERLIRWLPGIIEAGRILARKCNESMGYDFSAVIEALGRWQEDLESINNAYDCVPTLPPDISSTMHEATHCRAANILSEFEVYLKESMRGDNTSSFILRQIQLWTEGDRNKWDTSRKGEASISPAEFDKVVSEACDSILVAMQRTQNTISMFQDVEENSNWLALTDTLFVECLGAFKSRKINTLLESALSSTADAVKSDENGAVAVGARWATALPIIQQYHNSLKEIVGHYANFQQALCKLALVLGDNFCQIASQGFCDPVQDSPATAESSEKLEEGTGLGAGKGENDISKDIQSDEDLTELAQEEHKDMHSNIDDQEDAVNMDHDELEGEIGDTPEGNTNKGDDEQAEDIDVDDEIGDVDDLDPSAIDEKLWDGSTDETRNEKQGSKEIGKKQNDEHLAADPDTKNGCENQSLNEEDETNEIEEDDEGEEGEGEQVIREVPERVDPHVEEEPNLDLPEDIDFNDAKQSSTISESDLDSVEGGSEISDFGSVEGDSIDGADVPGEQKVADYNDDPLDFEETAEKEENLHQLQEKGEEIMDTNQEEQGKSSIDMELDGDGSELDQNLPQDHAMLSNTDMRDDPHSGTQACFEQYTQGAEGKQPQNSNNPGQGGRRQDLVNQNNTVPSMNEPFGQNNEQSIRENEEENKPEEQSGNPAFKKLGDALESWYRRQQEIQSNTTEQAAARNELQEANMIGQEFEHLHNDQEVADSQALGAATHDQAHALDEQALQSQLQDESSEMMDEGNIAQELAENDQQVLEYSKSHDTTDADHQDLSRLGTVLFENNVREHWASSGSATPSIDLNEEINDLGVDLTSTHLHSAHSPSQRTLADASRLWAHYESRTHSLSLNLTEQLRLILAPTLATKMRGDFRTGKRLNIKRIIPYIASNFKRDKIWMRRSVPSKRVYQILLAVDDSKSMSESQSGYLALETLALVTKSLSMLEAGEMCILSFGTDVRVAHPFDRPFSADAGPVAFQYFNFQQPHTDVKKLLQSSLALFHEARQKSARTGAADLWQLQLIVSDGVCEDHDTIRRLVRKAQDERIVIIFVIVDAIKGESILDMSQAVFEPVFSGKGAALGMLEPTSESGANETTETKLRIKRYLDDFPFPYYLVAGDVKELPGVLATALRQWFAEVVESG